MQEALKTEEEMSELIKEQEKIISELKEQICELQKNRYTKT